MDKAASAIDERKPLPGLRRLLQLFAELAALHDRGGCGARSDPGKVRQRPAVGHALRRRPLFGAVGQGRRRDVVHDLCGAARGMPDLHARRCRMRDGAEAARVAGVGLNTRRPGERRGPYAAADVVGKGRSRPACKRISAGGYGSRPSPGRHRRLTPSPLRRGLRRRFRRRSGRRWRAAWSRA